VADGPSPLAAEGVPYAFRVFNLLGGYRSIEAFASGNPRKPAKRQPDPQVRQFPLADSVIGFVD